MTTKAEFEVAEKLIEETTDNAETIELALSDMDLIGGGSVGQYFH